MGVDETGDPPRTGGVFRRLARGRTKGLFCTIMGEELFGPSRYEARIVMEEQKNLGQQAPAPGDPDSPESPAPSTESPFRGTFVVHRPTK